MTNGDEPVMFYRVGDPYDFLSNFSEYALHLDGKHWPTVEHYYQAQKFLGTPDEDEVRQAESALQAAIMGRERTRPLRADWDQVRDSIMERVVAEKFRQHPDIAQKLRDTGTRRLVKHTKGDAYWGDGGDGSGQNRLGEILMRLRDRLNAEG
ncbi:NADAR family protein [Phaeovibrio sulfidiphilus]|uniref:NADAR family protein n=1 Tax=Phaeovibrio sulfidiphilus TaxID=1220600 RepID=A0A8J7CVJ8_9PROT|nr:NADAR family protein [Phaeovibrio sulfidiphilus]MBE1236391.1 NADAR family protein [Phaeovibrio sulfidiphilus]